jgi:hypothetical protein
LRVLDVGLVNVVWERAYRAHEVVFSKDQTGRFCMS